MGTTLKAALLALAMGASNAEQTPFRTLKMKARTRPMATEVAKNARYAAHAQQHAPGLQLDVTPSSPASSPNGEATAYWGYPMTLDYTIDIAVQTEDGANYTEYPVILDTGSSNLALAVSSCTNCGEGATDLDVGLQEDMCIEVTYGSGAWSGYMTDQLKVGFLNDEGENLVDMVNMAGITSQTGFFDGGYNGIFGLGYIGLAESYSSSSCSSGSSSMGGGQSQMGGGQSQQGGGQSQQGGQSQPMQRGGGRQQQGRQQQGQQSQQHGMRGSPAPHRRLDMGQGQQSSTTVAAVPLIDSMYSHSLLNSDVFTILFCSDEATLGLGGVDPTLLKEEVKHVAVQKTYGEIYGYYLVYMKSIKMDNATIYDDTSTLNAIGGVLVDSGTTLIYLPSAATSAIESKVMAAAPTLSSQFFQWEACVSEDELKSMPGLTLELDGYDFVMEPRDYTLYYGGCYYWGIATSSVPIIGNVGMQNKMVVFDRTANTIGFAEGVCSATPTVSLAAGTAAPATTAAPSSVSTFSLGAGAAVAVAAAALVAVRQSRRYSAIPAAEELEAC